jgi:selenocysteine-specific elongation factor
MVAGASGIDLFLLVVAADDGVMPQTREHLAVLRALGIETGVVAVTKVDAVDAAALERAREQAAGLGAGEPIAISARTGEGLDELRAALLGAADRARAQPRRGDPDDPAVLHVDRVFGLRGIGTVATGTLWSGTIRAGQRIEVLPDGAEARVRSLQVHGADVEEASAGRRLALGLTGPGKEAIEPGSALASPGSGVEPSYRLDVELRLEPRAGSLGGERVQVHHGTRDAPARLVELGDGFAQLRLERELIARTGDRLVIRTIAEPDTVGGAVVLDPAPRRHGAGAAAERLRAIRERGLAAVRAEEDRAAAPSDAAPVPAPRPPGRRARVVLAVLDADGAEPRSPAAIAEALKVSEADVGELLAELAGAGLAVRLDARVYYSAAALDELRARAVELARRSGALTLAEVRTELGTSRKYAQALLEHLDATGVTVRHGDRHVLRRPLD